ncbi:hypothetical protein [Mycolicibacterium komossense]|uniref:Uncharacterized protein n=1 Tax=Mycolicibacterium komossense TaxID=1779 RepID=A0ABT3CFQ0_9MYCO|nr:hypothetical protein [Mycolicibacterium komossense]MCV7228290.1 hypothetical protein [Mycolicibacterium komossense]
MVLAFVGIVIAIALGVVALLRPAAQAAAPVEAAPQYAEQQVARAKTTICDDYDKAFKTVSAAGSLPTDDPTLKFAIPVNVRLATQFSANYLRNALSQNEATPSDLAAAAQKLPSTWDEVVLAQIPGSQNDDLSPTFTRLEAAGDKVMQACRR